MSDNEDFAFGTHQDVVRVVRSMENDLFQIVPRIIWAAQTDQLGSAVRNHIEHIGYEVDNETLLVGMLYGALLTINLEAQNSDISPSSIMLASVLLNMTEEPMNSNNSEFESIKKQIDRSASDNGVFKRFLHRMSTSVFGQQ